MKRNYEHLAYYGGQSTTELNIKPTFSRAGFNPNKNYQELDAIVIKLKNEYKMKYHPEF